MSCPADKPKFVEEAAGELVMDIINSSLEKQRIVSMEGGVRERTWPSVERWNGTGAFSLVLMKGEGGG